MATTTLLSTKNLMELFGVTAMTIHNWKKPRHRGGKHPMPEQTTAAKVTAWARAHGRVMTCDPKTLLGKDRGKPGPKPKQAPEPRASAAVKKWNADMKAAYKKHVIADTKKTAKVDPSRAGSFGRAAAVKNSKSRVRT